MKSVIAVCLTLSAWAVAAQSVVDRDYVFTDEDGHLVIRFAGNGAAALDEAQAYEILNQEFSRMVHDRLHADLRFAEEPRDPEWSAGMAPTIIEHLALSGIPQSAITVTCRTQSCRVIIEQAAHMSVAEHQSAMDRTQETVSAFISAQPRIFDPVFLITAYDQAAETPHIKAFLRRVDAH